jgi:hypothetical protein
MKLIYSLFQNYYTSKLFGITFQTLNQAKTLSAFGVSLCIMFCAMSVKGQNNALNFDGTNDYITVSDNNSLDFGTITNFTLETWVKYSASMPNYTGLVVKGTTIAGWVGYQMLLVNNHVATEIRDGTNMVSAEGTTSLNDGNWHHLAMVVTRTSNNVKLYVDGIQEANVTNVAIGGNIDNDSNLLIGVERTNALYLGGNMDEVRVWNVARTCSEIKANMNNELIGSETGLVAYYNFNQGTAGGTNTGVTTLTDIAGGDNNGTLTNFGLTTTTSNWVDGSGNGVTGTTPQIPAEINVTVGASGSTKDVGGYTTGTLVDFTYTIQNTGGMNLSLTNTPIIEVTSGTGFTVQTQPSASSIAGGNSLTFVIRFTPAVLGTAYTTNFQILNTDCDESTYTFTLTGKAISATPSGVRGNMFVGDGTDDKVDLGNVLASNFERTSTFSLECWFKTSVNINSFFTKIQQTGNNTGFGLGANNTGKINFSLVSTPLSALSVETTAAFTDGNWHHVVCTYNGSSSAAGVEIYVDGVEQGLTTIFNTLSASTVNTESLFLGASLDGNVDELRIWNTVRTQDQIRENMHLTLSGSEAGLVAYYQLNETTGSVIDAIGGLNGVLVDNANRITSTVSVSKGTSNRQTISSTGTYTFNNLAIRFNAFTAGSPDFVVYQLYDKPYNNLTGTATTSNYWLVRQFGAGTFTYDQMTFTIPSSNIINESAPLSDLKLYKRNTNSGDNTWGGAEINTGVISASNTTKVIVYTVSESSFSEFIPASGSSALPITLAYFHADRTDAKTVLLTWATNQEINNKAFEIEQSTDNKVFEKVGMVDGAGNKNQITNYKYQIINGNAAYYRLKQVDVDGNFTHTASRFVEAGNILNMLALYPNPTDGKLTLSLGEGFTEKVNVQVFSGQGKLLLSEEGMMDMVSQTLNQRLSQWSSGIYLIQLRTGNKMYAKQFVLNR